MQITVRVTEIILQWVLVSTLITSSISTNCKNLIMLHVLNISSCLLTKKKVLSIFLVLILLHPFFNIHRNWFFSLFSTSRMCMEYKVWRTITCQLHWNTLVLQASNVKGISELFQQSKFISTSTAMKYCFSLIIQRWNTTCQHSDGIQLCSTALKKYISQPKRLLQILAV